MNTDFLRFVCGFVPPFLLAASYIALVLVHAPNPDSALHTLLSNPALSFFQPVVLPVISGVIAVAALPHRVLPRRAVQLRGWYLLALYISALAAALVYSDSKSALELRMVEPIQWKEASDRVAFFGLDSTLRENVGKPALCPEVKSTAKTARECYVALLQARFSSAIVPSEKLGIVSIWQRLLSGQAAFIGVLIVTMLVWFHSRGKAHGEVQDAIIKALSLATIWIPLRIYSDWYIAIRDMDGPTKNPVLGAVGLLMVLALAVTIIRRYGGPVSKVAFAIILALTSAVASTLASLSPKSLGVLADLFSSWNLTILLAFDGSLLLLLWVLVGPSVGRERLVADRQVS